MFALSIERRAKKDFKKIPITFSPVIIAKIKNLANNPYPQNCKKLVNSQNFWRIRIGSYRVIYEVIEADNIVRIYKIRHRKDVYR